MVLTVVNFFNSSNSACWYACLLSSLVNTFAPDSASTVVSLMSDHKSHLKRGLPYLMGNQEVTPKALVPDYQPNKANPF